MTMFSMSIVIHLKYEQRREIVALKRNCLQRNESLHIPGRGAYSVRKLIRNVTSGNQSVQDVRNDQLIARIETNLCSRKTNSPTLGL